MTEIEAPALSAPSDLALPQAQAEIESARAEIESLKIDKAFYDRLMKKDPEAHAKWADLHRVGYPSPPAPTTPAEIEAQQNSRNAEAWNTHFSWLRTQMNVTPENEAEIRGGVIDERWYQWARDEKDRLVRDRNFYRRLLDGDRSAKDSWARVNAMLSLRPVKK